MAELQLPRMDFSVLGNLPETFREGRKAAREQQIQDTRQMTLADLGAGGPIDYSTASRRLLAAGDLQGGLQLAQLGKVDTTDEIKEYKLSQAQGFKGSFTDWKTGLKRAGATNVNTTVNSGEKSYDTALGKEYADTFIGAQKAGRNAVGQVATLDQMEKLTDDPNFYSGAGAERFVLPVKQIVAKMGGDPNAAAPMETFRALSSKGVLDTMGGSLGTGFSNADRDFVVSQVPNLGNTPDGNRQLIQIHKKVAQRTQEIAKLARNYAAKNGGRIDAGFDGALSQWAEQNPIFAKPAGTGAPAPAAQPRPSGQQGQPVQVRTPQERDSLPPGTTYVAPDGSIRTKQ
jgi:hypothetical protein